MQCHQYYNSAIQKAFPEVQWDHYSPQILIQLYYIIFLWRAIQDLLRIEGNIPLDGKGGLLDIGICAVVNNSFNFSFFIDFLEENQLVQVRAYKNRILEVVFGWIVVELFWTNRNRIEYGTVMVKWWSDDDQPYDGKMIWYDLTMQCLEKKAQTRVFLKKQRSFLKPSLNWAQYNSYSIRISYSSSWMDQLWLIY